MVAMFKKKLFMSEVIVIGQNYNTSLGLIKSLGEGGFRCSTVKFNKKISLFRTLFQVFLSPDLCSKYVDKWVTLAREPEEILVNSLIEKFSDETCKKIVLPADDYCAYVLDKNYQLLSDYFYVPHITHRESSLGDYMNKQNQKIIAKSSGINISKTWCVHIEKGEQPSIPKGIQYPCITKPQSSIGLPKSYIQKCNNFEELHSLLMLIAKETSCEILIEEYIEVEEEFTIPGISDGVNVMIPSFIKKIVIGKGSHKGVTICGKVKDSSLYQDECSKLIELVKTIGFTGIFDIEMLKSGNKFYLNEINFRNGAAGLSLTKAGINLPSIYVNKLLNGVSFPLSYLRPIELTFVNDKAALEHYLAGECSKTEYDNIVNHVTTRLIDNKDDRLAQMSFRLLRLKSFVLNKLKK